ncbi:hypothetical protein KAS14_04535 [Candidatus Bathyarchaeota archaeon]|jgi:predicted transcriptional regulator|nr:hypothetical protein [Candidatus Bathyarchaeota archaeon]
MSFERNEMISFIENVNPSAASRLNNLIEKKQELIEKGNVYGESYTERRFWLVVDPIIKTEYKRSQILQKTKNKALSVREIAKELSLSSKEVLLHITALRQRNLILLDRIEGTSPKYLAALQEGTEA